MEVTNHLVSNIVLMDMVIHLDAAMNEDEKPIMWMDLETNHSATSLMAEYSLKEFRILLPTSRHLIRTLQENLYHQDHGEQAF